MNRRAMKMAIGVLVSVCALPSAGLAQVVIEGTLSNFDVWNRTGNPEPANDFHVRLNGIEPADINNLFTGRFPNYPDTSIVGALNRTDITWTGSTTALNFKAHFGVRLNGGLNPTSTEMNWTFNGNNIGSIGDVAQKWRTAPGFVIDDITNRSNTLFWIQRRFNLESAPSRIVLDDLLVGLPLWNGATMIDQRPIPLRPGETQLFQFQMGPNTGAVVMMYEVFADLNGSPGEPVLTFLNAAVVPSPGGAPLLIALGGLVAVRRRR